MTGRYKKAKTYEDYLREAGLPTLEEQKKKETRLWSGVQYNRPKKINK